MDALTYARDVGHRVRRKRQMLGLSQATLASRAALPQSFISKLEVGQVRLCNLWHLRQLCAALLTTPDFVLGFTDEPGEVPLRPWPEAAASFACAPLPL